MHRSRVFAMGLFVAGLLVIGLGSNASADSDKQKDKGHNAPDVPLTAGLPIMASLSGGAYYLVARTRTAMSRKRSASGQSESDTTG